MNHAEVDKMLLAIRDSLNIWDPSDVSDSWTTIVAFCLEIGITAQRVPEFRKLLQTMIDQTLPEKRSGEEVIP